MTNKLSVGALGYRFMGKAHSNVLARLSVLFPDVPDVGCSVIVGHDEEALSDAAERFGLEPAVTDWRDAVDDVDVSYNPSPNHLHAEPSIAALEAGASVFREKSLAPTLDEAKAMRDAARVADGVAGYAFNYRLVPATRYVKRLIESGELGETRHVRGRYLQDRLVDVDAPWTWRMDEDTVGSGVFGDLGAHIIDLVRFPVSDRASGINRISGHLQTFVDERPAFGENEYRPVTVDGAYTAQAEFENGAVGSLEASCLAGGHKSDHTIKIHGSEGDLRSSLERLNRLEVKTGDARGYETVLVIDEDDSYLDHWWPPGYVLGWEHTFVHENYEFLSAIVGGSDFSPLFEDGYEVQLILDAIERSDEVSEWVSLD